MIRMIHRDTGVEMWVPEKEVAKFIARGHKAAPAPMPTKRTSKRPVKKVK